MPGDPFVITSIGGVTGTTDPEIVRDTIAGALVAGSGVQIASDDAANTITISLTPQAPASAVITSSGGNFIPNPTFGDSTTGYFANSGSSLTLDVTNGIFGTNAGSVSRSGSTGAAAVTSPRAVVKPNVVYSGLAWFRLGTLGRTSAAQGTASINWYDATSTLISTTTGLVAQESIQGTWTNSMVLSATSPSTAASAEIVLSVAPGTAGETHLVDGFSLQAGSIPMMSGSNFATSTFTGSVLAPGSVTNRETSTGSAKPMFGTGAARPSATGSGRMYVATDTGASYLDTGSWVAITGSSGGSTTPAEPQPGDFALKSWTYDPMLIGSNTAQALTAGVLGLTRFHLRNDSTISNIVTGVVSAGTTVVNQYFGLYNASGVLLGTTADVSATMTSVGLKTSALTTPYVATAGTYYIGFLTGSAATTPKFAVGPSGGNAASFSGMVNVGTTAMYRSATYSTGFSTLPSLLTTSTATADSRAWWFAVS